MEKLTVAQVEHILWSRRGSNPVPFSLQSQCGSDVDRRLHYCMIFLFVYAVMRTQGSLRVILNTKIWAGMNVERASTKAIRITATDVDQTVKVFLIMVSIV
jgi:hypothetical protein